MIKKEWIEKLNHDAYKKMKKEKIAEKEKKDRMTVVQHKQGKMNERLQLVKKNQDHTIQEVNRDSNAAVKKHWKETEERLAKKLKDDAEKSKTDYLTASADIMSASKMSTGNI